VPTGWTGRLGTLVDPNCPDKQGGTPLSYAAREGHGVAQLPQAGESVDTLEAPAPGERTWDSQETLTPFFFWGKKRV